MNRIAGKNIRSVRHDEAGWNGYGARDLSLDRRVARWAPVGRKKRTARREVHLHVTGRIESRVMMADDCVFFVVDDDERIREDLGELLASHDMRAIRSEERRVGKECVSTGRAR